MRQLCAVIALSTAGCGSGGRINAVAEDSGPQAGVDAEGRLKVIIAIDSELAGSNIEVTCPSGPSFPASALDAIPLIADSGLAGVAEGIEPFLSSGEGDFCPQDGWRVLHATDDQVQLVQVAHAEGAEPAPAERAVSFMSLEGSDGAWKWTGASGASPCPLKTTLPDGLNSVEWELDPSATVPETTATSFRALATERNCVSGRGMGDRLLGPEVVLTDDAVLLAFAATPPPGEFQECPGNPSIAVTVELGEQIGKREIRDGFATGASLADFIN